MKSGLGEQKSRFGSEPRFRDQLRRRSDLDLKINTRRNVFSYPVIFCLFCFVTPLYRDFPQLFWPALAGVIFTTVSRQAIVLSYDRLYPENPKLWRRLLESGIVLGAVIWGVVQARPETVSLSVAVCFYLLMMIIFSRSIIRVTRKGLPRITPCRRPTMNWSGGSVRERLNWMRPTPCSGRASSGTMPCFPASMMPFLSTTCQCRAGQANSST